jgi:hypothetical protein
MTHRGRRIAVWLAVAAVLAAPSAAAAADDPPYDTSAYWRVADRLQQPLDPQWRDGSYFMGGGAAALNGQMLTTHALAALHGHVGAARNDERARAIVRTLVASPPFLRRLLPGPGTSLSHAPGWSASLQDAGAAQHPVFDTQVVDGLVAAWRAREPLHLGPALVRRIEHEVVATAAGRFYRWPALRVNQFNWNADMLAAAATVGGRTRALRRDLRRYVDGFAHGANLGPGLRFHYAPSWPTNDPLNVDSAEYANIVLSFAAPYRQARQAGMRAPSPEVLRLIREWTRRALAGYWTHGGYLNWDTGFGFRRWHQAKKLGLAQEALLGLTATPELLPSRRYARWSKWLLDRSIGLYDRWVQECRGGLPPPVSFGVHVHRQRPCDAALAAARVQANAARAADAGLGSRPAARPPALYSFDPDTGRLAVTTSTYNTAVIVVNQRAFPYGGLDLARLYDGEQEVAANIGGRPPASFGLVVRDRGGRRLLATQTGRPRVNRRVTPLRLLHAPRGAGATADARPTRAFAGPFRRLRASGSMRRGPVFARVVHEFAPRWIETRWTARGARAGRTVDVLFPSWGRGATVTAVLTDGSSVQIGRERRPLERVRWLRVQSARSGYLIVPRGRPKGATLRLLHPRPQGSAPRPGPTLAVGLAGSGRRLFAARIATVSKGDAALPR